MADMPEGLLSVMSYGALSPPQYRMLPAEAAWHKRDCQARTVAIVILRSFSFPDFRRFARRGVTMSLKGSKEEFNELRISGFYAARQIQKILLIERGLAQFFVRVVRLLDVVLLQLTYKSQYRLQKEVDLLNKCQC